MMDFKRITILAFYTALAMCSNYTLISQDVVVDKHIENKLNGFNWGYSYDDLLIDIDKWENNEFITVDSIGASVQNRALWELKITSKNNDNSKHVVYIHTRTHPNEVQSFWVVNEIINYLISDEDLAVQLRKNTIFYIIPMYNPDGVELKYPRENANKINIESNWYSNNIQKEVLVLRNRFEDLMDSESPIEIALNMHSAYKCKRYFVYHHINGTSLSYTKMEKRFINYVVGYFPNGIEPWDFIVTWKNGTPKKYPESWWWLNHGKSVLALTYEDGNCEEAGEFDKTAFSILSGISNYFRITSPVNTEELFTSDDYILEQSYPNPANTDSYISIKYKTPTREKVKLELFDINGSKVLGIFNGVEDEGWHTEIINTYNLESGNYYYRFTTKNVIITKKMVIVE